MGFTLIELVVVTAVLAVLLVAAIPKFQQTFQRLRAEQTAFEFAQLLRYAHERAVSQGDMMVVLWDAQARRAVLRITEEPALPDEPLECAAARTPLAPPVDSARVPSDISISIVREDQAGECVSFFPDGTSEPATLHIAQGGLDHTVTVDAATSQVRLSIGTAAR